MGLYWELVVFWYCDNLSCKADVLGLDIPSPGLSPVSYTL